MGRVLVVGSYNAGLTVFTDRLPRPGETIGDARFDSGPGGKGANQAVGLRRLGVDAAFIARLGADPFGEQGRDVLLEEGLPAWGLLTGADPTGVAFIMVQDDGENSIVVAPGANAALTLGDVTELEDRIGAADVVVVQLECRAELAVDVARWARAAGRRCVLNPAPVRPLTAEELACFDVITPNETELAGLTEALGLEASASEAQAVALVDLGVDDVIVTLGESGALWASVSGTRRFASYPVEVRDTTGAGDAFNAGLVAGLAGGATMPEAIDLGCRAGAYCVTRAGVIDGLATRRALDDLQPEEAT